jgi:flagellar biosynthesis/type III secretory pathway protein FliH
MFAFRTPNFLRLVPLACLLFGARAFAQFEISPDHFDSETDRPVKDAATKTKARTTASKDGEAAIETVAMQQRIAEQQAVLAGYRAQINAIRAQMDAALQSLLRTGNEAGEAEALTIYQRELDKLQKSLAPAIHATEATLARLQAEMVTESQLRTRHAVRHRAL